MLTHADKRERRNRIGIPIGLRKTDSRCRPGVRSSCCKFEYVNCALRDHEHMRPLDKHCWVSFTLAHVSDTRRIRMGWQAGIPQERQVSLR